MMASSAISSGGAGKEELRRALQAHMQAPEISKEQQQLFSE
jgi:hypothetical protein